MYDELGNLLDEVESKKRRLARKAELARMSRKRKKTRMGDLEAEVQRLQQEIHMLKKQKNGAHGNGNNNNAYVAAMNMIKSSDESDSVVPVNDEVTEQGVNSAINHVINTYYANANGGNSVNGGNSDGAVEDGVKKCIDELVLQHTSYVQSGERHLHAIQHHIQPIVPLDFLTWICCTQDDNNSPYQYNVVRNANGGVTISNNTNNNTLWHSLFVDELGLDGEQMKDLMSVKTTIKKQSKLNIKSRKLIRSYNNI